MSSEPLVFSDQALDFPGYQGTGWVDFDLHDDSRPESETSMAVRVMLSPAMALELAERLIHDARLAVPDSEARK